jgi:predicted GNAT superfamily acetyltransferase
MGFESIYPEPLQLEISEKAEIRDSLGSIFVWMFVNGELVGESYGIPVESLDESLEGVTDLPQAEIKSAIYCYSNTIFPAFQGKGFGTILKAHWSGWAAAKGFTVVYGHARPGPSQTLNAKGPRTNNLDNLGALRKERVVPVWMESSRLKIQFFHL